MHRTPKRLYQAGESLADPEAAVLRTHCADSRVEHCAVLIPFNREETDQFLLAFNEDDEKIPFVTAVENDAFFVEGLAQMATRVADSNAWIPCSESPNRFRNIG